MSRSTYVQETNPQQVTLVVRGLLRANAAKQFRFVKTKPFLNRGKQKRVQFLTIIPLVKHRKFQNAKRFKKGNSLSPQCTFCSPLLFALARDGASAMRPRVRVHRELLFPDPETVNNTDRSLDTHICTKKETPIADRNNGRRENRDERKTFPLSELGAKKERSATDL